MSTPITARPGTAPLLGVVHGVVQALRSVMSTEVSAAVEDSAGRIGSRSGAALSDASIRMIASSTMLDMLTPRSFARCAHLLHEGVVEHQGRLHGCTVSPYSRYGNAVPWSWGQPANDARIALNVALGPHDRRGLGLVRAVVATDVHRDGPGRRSARRRSPRTAPPAARPRGRTGQPARHPRSARPAPGPSSGPARSGCRGCRSGPTLRAGDLFSLSRVSVARSRVSPSTCARALPLAPSCRNDSASARNSPRLSQRK